MQIYRPAGTVKQVALFLSGDAGWDRGMAGLATELASSGSLVVGIDVPKFFATLEKDGGTCVFPGWRSGEPQPFRPGVLQAADVLHAAAGRLLRWRLARLCHSGSGAEGYLRWALSLSFCQELDLAKPLCKTESLQYSALKEGARLTPPVTLRAPWYLIHGADDKVCAASEARQFASLTRNAHYVEMPNVGHNYPRNAELWMPQFKAAYAQLATTALPSLPAPPQSLEDLPLVEVPAETEAGDMFAVFLSGDGGWAGLDKEVGSALSARGIPIAGIDSLRYFWKARTPNGLASDLDRIIRYYSFHWKKSRVLLIGYSQGADVLPFGVNRLPAATRSIVQLTTLIGLGKQAAFEFHVTNWSRWRQRPARSNPRPIGCRPRTRCVSMAPMMTNRSVPRSGLSTRT